MSTLASTAMAMLSATPARPGSVKVASMNAITPKITSAVTISEWSAMAPATR